MNNPTREGWTFDLALEFLRDLDGAAKEAGYGVALTGGVLRNGASAKDLDVIVYPLDSSVRDEQRLKAQFVAFGLTQTRTSEEVQAGWRKQGSADLKRVEEWRWRYGGRRVDVFFLS